MDDWHEHAMNYAKLDNDEARGAYFALVIAAERAGYRTEAGPGGNKRHVKIMRDEVQPYSFIVNNGNLLFYLRAPALKSHPELRAQAIQRFGDRVEPHPNSANETTVRIRSPEDAIAIADLVF